ncbi:DUF4231 domain-containing protein [Microbacterium sp.]|uniref:DUF4231 domain-containing protein n=1 Tax=Microbacterium sp. TaxID=51671 RepID=UPI0028112A37|nr:DUF4231 domain-containing protein [Microbacterium sp.]
MSDPLYGGGYPAFYESADAASLTGQNQYLLAMRVRLGGLVLGTIGGSVFVSTGFVALGGWMALGGFLVALVAEIWNAVQKPDRAWYEGRAAAESAKTLAWRYAVKGESFEDGTDANRELVARVTELLDDLKDVDLPSSSKTTDQVTAKMREIRSASFEERRSAYREGRIEDQRSWYAKKADWNRKAAHGWTLLLFVFELLGVVGGVLLITGTLTVDLLGLFAALAAAVTAWTQAKQFKTLATAYGVTAQELSGVKNELDEVKDEAEWAQFVGQAEEAISREHTLWRASRGVRISGPRSGPA